MGSNPIVGAMEDVPGVKGQKFKLLFDRSEFGMGQILETSTGALVQVVDVYKDDWWKKLLRWAGFRMPQYSVKVVQIRDKRAELHTMYLNRVQVDVPEGWRFWEFGPSAEGPTFEKGDYRFQTLGIDNVDGMNANLRVDPNVHIWIESSGKTVFLGLCRTLEELQELFEKVGA